MKNLFLKLWIQKLEIRIMTRKMDDLPPQPSFHGLFLQGWEQLGPSVKFSTVVLPLPVVDLEDARTPLRGWHLAPGKYWIHHCLLDFFLQPY